jgi:hypothetical protein
MAFEKNPDELGALWIKHGPNSDYMTGEIAGIKVVVFKSKKTSEKSPDWRVLKSKPRDEKKPIADVDVPF